MEKTRVIDHTLLRPDAQCADVDRLIDEARQASFASVCVQPTWVAHAAHRLAGSSVMVCTVIGFPHGASTTATKAFETTEAVRNGADEVDMVVNLGAVKQGEWGLVRTDIASVIAATGPGVGVKVIFETCLLTGDEIVRLCEICTEEGAAFVKTSTGFASGGATVEAVRLMSAHVGNGVGVKASGGIRTPEQLTAFLEAGATRIGASAGLALFASEETPC